MTTDAFPNIDVRPWNSIRFKCARCGRLQTFPTAPLRGRQHTSDYRLADGTRKTVTADMKVVECPCGLTTCKERRSFDGS